MCIASSLTTSTSINSQNYYQGDQKPIVLTWISHQCDSELILSTSMVVYAHEKSDLEALLSFKKVITSNPLGRLSNWVAKKSDNICSWFGIHWRKHTSRVVAIDLHEESPYA